MAGVPARFRSASFSGRAEALAKAGGVEEDRTPDLRVANATLSQLSYDPSIEQ